MSAPPEWWRTFFSGAMVEFWLRAMTEEETRLEADFIEEMLRVAPPARLLDVPCGGGRHSLALAGRGYRMTGVDVSAEFLAAARAGAAGRSLEVRWEQRDMRDLPGDETFDGAFCFGNSFGYLDDAGNADFLKAVGRALRGGAKFLLDTSYVAEVLFPTLQERAWYPVEGGVVLADRRYDPVGGRLYVEYITIRDGHGEKWPMSARIHTCREVHELLEEAGFTDVQGFGSFTREPFRLGSPRLVLTATKKGD
jgi:SAM-dependent methyltransferase